MTKRIEQDKNRQAYIFIIILTIAVAMGLQGWRTLLNNFAVEQVGIDGSRMGILQAVREVPGFLCLFVVYLLFLFREQKLIVHSAVLLGIGVAVTGYLPSFVGLLFSTTILSIGFHYFETTRQSLILQNFDNDDSVSVLGKLRSYSAMTNILVGVLIVFMSEFLSYKMLFLLIGTCVVLVASIAYRIRLDNASGKIEQHKKIIFRKKYWLYYVLNFLSGARRQIFVVFSVFLLVQHYGFSVQLVSILFIINNSINIFIAPFIAKKIINIGEKKVLLVGYIAIFFIFIFYAACNNAVIVAFLYVLDNIFFNINIGIRTYFKKHADARDIASGMAAGFTINHITAVIFPLVAGYLWMTSVKLPFLLGAFIALFSVFFVLFMKSEKIAGKATKIKLYRRSS